MRRWSLLTALIWALAIGCASERDVGAHDRDSQVQIAAEGQPAAVETVDGLGRVVRLARPAARIASLASGFTETLFAIGCGDRIILRDRWSDYPAEASKIPATDGLKPSVEHVSGFRPDLTLLYSADGRQLAVFSRVGLEVAVFDPKSYDEVVIYVEKLGVLCGEPERAREVADRMREVRKRLDGARPDESRPLVYAEVDATDPARPWTAGPGSFVDELIRLAGGRNVAADVSSAYSQVNAEAIIRADPEVILRLDVARAGATAGRPVALTERPGWTNVSAVVNDRVIDHIDGDILSRPGPRLADALAALSAALFPGGGR